MGIVQILCSLTLGAIQTLCFQPWVQCEPYVSNPGCSTNRMFPSPGCCTYLTFPTNLMFPTMRAVPELFLERIFNANLFPAALLRGHGGGVCRRQVDSIEQYVIA